MYTILQQSVLIDKRDSTNFYNNLNKLNAYFQTTVEQILLWFFHAQNTFRNFKGIRDSP